MPHHPGHVREAFEALFDGRDRQQLPLSDTEVRRAVTAVWTCTDIMPRCLCEDLDMRPGSTYAQAAQGLLREWKAMRLP